MPLGSSARCAIACPFNRPTIQFKLPGAPAVIKTLCTHAYGRNAWTAGERVEAYNCDTCTVARRT